MAQVQVVSRCAVVVALLLLGGTASAANTSFDFERLWLDPSARGSLVIGSGETLPSGGARLSLAGGWERSPLVLTSKGLRGRGLFSNDHRIGDVVRDRFTVHVTGAVAITSRLEFGFRLPVTVSQNGSDLSASGFPELRRRALGTLSAMFRYGITQQGESHAFSSAVAVEAGFPTSRIDDVDGSPRPYFLPRLELGHRTDSYLAAVDLGAALRPNSVGVPFSDKLHHEITAGAVLATVGRPARYEVSLRGAFNANGLGAHGELLGGARWQHRFVELYALAGPGFGNSPGTPTFRALVGVALFKPEEAPREAAAPPPPPPPDPCAPGQVHTPEQCPDLDDDGDGIPNGQDKCPTVKGIAELQGCPAVDTDGDGIPDHLDKCPAVKGTAKYQGCPPPDRDGDGIPDDEDKCPDQPGIPELQGCPPKDAEIKGERIEVRQKVFFDTGKATVQQRSYPLLDDVAKLIVANPQVGTIRIEGHTDDRGSAELNRNLSQARAEAVQAYLVSRGVDPARLEAQGFGPDRPAASNKTAAGREANRRVEFTILGIPKS